MNPLRNNFIRIAIGTALLLLVPLGLTIWDGNVPNVGWNWSPGDFVFAFMLIFGIGSLFELVRRIAANNTIYKFAAGMALAGVFLLIWVNGAVGIIGDSDINILYAGVVFTLFLGSIISRLRPRGMSITLFAAACVQFLIPIVALALGEQDFRPGVLRVFILNGFWVVLFTGSGILFRQAFERTQPKPDTLE